MSSFNPSIRHIHQNAGMEIEDGDLVLSLGAGNIHEAGAQLVSDLAARDRLLGAMGPGSDPALRTAFPPHHHARWRPGAILGGARDRRGSLPIWCNSVSTKTSRSW